MGQGNIAEHSGGARKESYAGGWGKDNETAVEKRYCARLKQHTPADKVCTGFTWIGDEYTPLVGCISCKYWEHL